MLLETATAVSGMLNPALRITGIALCMYDKGTRLAQEVDNDVRQFIASAAPDDVWHGARVFDTVIRRNVKLAECPSFGRTIFDYAPGSNGAEDYGGLAREMLEMASGTARPPDTSDGQTAEGAPAEPSVVPARVVPAGDSGVESAVVREVTAEADAILGSGSTSPADPLAPQLSPETRPAVTPDRVNP